MSLIAAKAALEKSGTIDSEALVDGLEGLVDRQSDRAR